MKRLFYDVVSNNIIFNQVDLYVGKELLCIQCGQIFMKNYVYDNLNWLRFTILLFKLCSPSNKIVNKCFPICKYLIIKVYGRNNKQNYLITFLILYKVLSITLCFYNINPFYIGCALLLINNIKYFKSYFKNGIAYVTNLLSFILLFY